MVSRILKCPSCASYSLHETCPCGATRVSPKPPKYSPDDKYAEYRRKYKEEHAGEKTAESAAVPSAAPPSSSKRPMHPFEAMRRGNVREE